MKYLTLFETTAAYNAATLDLPNVSLIEENMSVSFNPYVEPETKLVAKFNVTDINNPTKIAAASNTKYGQFGQLIINIENNFSQIEIDGVAQSDIISEYTFNTTGEHIVKYTLVDSTIVGDGFFYGCNGLTNVTIPDSVTSIGTCAFYSCIDLTSVIIPDGVTIIHNNTFSYCRSLTSIAIPNSVTSIDNYAFYECNNLSSIDIPDGVTSIGYNAFAYCTGLTSVTIPDSITIIDSIAFLGCSDLTSIVSNAIIAPTIQSDTFKDIKIDGTLTVPADSTGYDIWMGTDDYYLGKYNWTKIEQ